MTLHSKRTSTQIASTAHEVSRNECLFVMLEPHAFKLYNRIIYFQAPYVTGWSKSSCRRPRARSSSSSDGSRPLRLDTGVLILGVMLSVFKRSVACPGHGLLQHVYGVTITCSSWFYIKRDIVKSSFESRVDTRKCCCLTLYTWFRRSHPKQFLNLPLVPWACQRSFACLGHAHFACLWCHDPLLPTFAYIGSFVFCRKGERFIDLLLGRVLGKVRDGAWKALHPMKSANLAVYAVTGAILLKCLTAHTRRGDVKRGFDLMLETMVDDALLSCVRGLPRLKHVESLSQFFEPFVLHDVERLCAPLWNHDQVFRTKGRCGLDICSMDGDERSWGRCLARMRSCCTGALT